MKFVLQIKIHFSISRPLTTPSKKKTKTYLKRKKLKVVSERRLSVL